MPIEKERLMGYEEGYTLAMGSDAKRGHGLGNAIVPQVAQVIMEAIKESENAEPSISPSPIRHLQRSGR